MRALANPRCWIILCAALAMACSEVTELEVVPEGAGPIDDSPGFGDGPDQPGQVVATVCDDGSECQWGICVPGEDGVETCAQPCGDGCAPGWTCKLVAKDGWYPKPFCIYLHATLCNPCNEDADCNQSVDMHFNRCISHGNEGSFCATNCGSGGLSCPTGYTCEEVGDGDGDLSQQCRPMSGLCQCNAYGKAQGLSTICANENDAGQCTGFRVCSEAGLSHCQGQLPMTESCNGFDDDCDDSIDEGVLAPCGGCGDSCTFETKPKVSSGVAPTQDPFGGGAAQVSSSDAHFIWIANSAASTVSRLDTDTGCEEARYYSCNDPSRTAVDADGSGIIACRGGGEVMKVAINEALCTDLNGNGEIDTSRDLNGDCTITNNEMVGQDECIIWKVKPPGASLARAAGIDEDGNAWIGDWNMPGLFQLDGVTGAVLKTHATTMSPYGLAIDSDGIIWVASRSPMSLGRVDPVQGQTGSWGTPSNECYGIAIDPWGKIWLAGGAGNDGVQRFDPVTQSWSQLAAYGHGFSRGVAIGLLYDQAFQLQGAKVYVAHSRYIDVYDAQTMALEGTVDLGWERGAVGVAMDLKGFLWSVNQGEYSASKIDTDTLQVVGTYPVGSGPYTYSDMTGYAFNTITSVQGAFREVFEGWEGSATMWDAIYVQANLPGVDEGLTWVEIQYRLGNTVDELKSSPWQGPFGPFPPMTFPLAISESAHYLEVKVLLAAADPTQVPSLEQLLVEAHKL